MTLPIGILHCNMKTIFVLVSRILFPATLSNVLDIKGNIEMGLRLFKISGSRKIFFKRGMTAANVKHNGTVADVNDVLIILTITGSNTGKQPFST